MDVRRAVAEAGQDWGRGRDSDRDRREGDRDGKYSCDGERERDSGRYGERDADGHRARCCDRCTCGRLASDPSSERDWLAAVRAHQPFTFATERDGYRAEISVKATQSLAYSPDAGRMRHNLWVCIFPSYAGLHGAQMA